ncbi:META domain-containing protein [Spirosoma montaniterrae]|uniref:DUF306 domain-containing protein n=1 Tax=Spirosoma montaniterrae TaxID=1178516 RepID=A0A1P9X1I0_9BACT|nr:META domain-containing protein [Spirosoma montaniterrae]AQG81496.1 hypothetical protein AWR27_20570 [Spirosoma montaniterrae]
MKQLIGCLLTLLTVGACQQSDYQMAPNVARLVGTWQLRDSTTVYAPTLQFELDTENPPLDITPFKASGKASVNTYNGRLSASLDGMMVVTGLGQTKIGGSPEAMRFEQTYFANLKSVARFKTTEDDRLYLYFGNPQPGTLIYERIK